MESLSLRRKLEGKRKFPNPYVNNKIWDSNGKQAEKSYIKGKNVNNGRWYSTFETQIHLMNIWKCMDKNPYKEREEGYTTFTKKDNNNLQKKIINKALKWLWEKEIAIKQEH